MYIKTAAALVAAIIVGTSSVALADPQFDVSIYTPKFQDNAMGAYAQQVPGQHRVAPQSFSPAEKLWFERASSPRNS